MTAEQFKLRTKQLGICVINMVDTLPRKRSADVISRQVLRSSTSIGANYRAVCRAQSTRDMLKKLKIVEEETDETMYWLEIIGEAGILPAKRLTELTKEANEILSMTVASIKTLRRKSAQSSIQNRKS
jgi:four helix bundle protein